MKNLCSYAKHYRSKSKVGTYTYTIGKQIQLNVSITTYNIRTANITKIKKINLKKLTLGIYLRIVAIPLATESFKEGETGASPKKISKREKQTFPDSIVASTLDGSPLDETLTCIPQKLNRDKNLPTSLGK